MLQKMVCRGNNFVGEYVSMNVSLGRHHPFTPGTKVRPFLQGLS